MKKLFDELAYEVSKKTTEKYSTSFSLGILALKPTIRKSIYAIYGYVRLAGRHLTEPNFTVVSGNCASI